MSDTPKFVNSYYNAQTEAKPTESHDFLAFYAAAETVLVQATELIRVVTNANQSAIAVIVNGDWSSARKYFSLSEKYAAWANYHTPATGYGIHGFVPKTNQTLRLTQVELEAHPEWRNFGFEKDNHPPMRGWLAMPLIGADGLNYGLMQASDRYDGDFTAEDEANMRRLATLTSTALDALAQTYIADYRQKIADMQR